MHVKLALFSAVGLSALSQALPTFTTVPTFTGIPTRTARFPQGSDLLPDPPRITTFVPVPISPGEPYSNINAPGPVVSGGQNVRRQTTDDLLRQSSAHIYQDMAKSLEEINNMTEVEKIQALQNAHECIDINRNRVDQKFPDFNARAGPYLAADAGCYRAAAGRPRGAQDNGGPGFIVPN